MTRHHFLILSAIVAFWACAPQNNSSGDNNNPGTTDVTADAATFAKGADISWVTEMESKGYKFYDASGNQTECTALMKTLGCNAVRYRVWVNPAGGWCNKADVVAKARRAQALGMAIMIDFHYSDTWADPGKQGIPASWPTSGVAELSAKIKEHTTDVLKALQSAGVNVSWVQVGNETNTGMCWEVGRVTNSGADNFAAMANAGYDAVKAVFPSALVIIHHSNAQKMEENKWFYDLIYKAGAKFDMIGLSLYPSYWDNCKNAYPDWTPACQSAVANFQSLYQLYRKPVMLVEFGMPVSEPAKAKAALQYVMDGVKDFSWFKGVFYWEPEAEHSRNGYDYGAFASGKSTGVMELFK